MTTLTYDGDLADSSRERRRMKGYDTCFPGGTRVLTTAGYMRIDQLSVGASVMTYDADTGILAQSRIKKLLEHTATTISEITFIDAVQKLRVTGNHRLRLSTGHWVKVQNLVPGLKLAGLHGQEVEIASISELRTPGMVVYNLYPYGHKTFIVEGVAAHSFTNFPTIREYWHSTIETLQARTRVWAPIPT